ncbi:MAG: hypothetical protein IPM74_03640 [Crocinitomicaceae bacterium]|nr:hypothetical protein [Crocinitomicaceae bacterium]MBK8925006.1 hypothetical protein [Crocinitomicaceae bacterium]
MSGFIFTAARKVQLIDDTMYEVVQVNVKKVNGKFLLTSKDLFVRVFNINNNVTGFINQFSGNHKEIVAYFTTDAFDTINSNVTIEFGLHPLTIDKFENIDINSVITPLSPADASLGAPQADNAWLNSLS